MSRKNARKHGFFLLFQLDFGFSPEEAMPLFFEENPELSDDDRRFIKSEIDGVVSHKEEIDKAISQTTKGWSLDRLAKVDVAILRLAIYELYFSQDIPGSVAINEAVELAKEFGAKESPSFINGILGELSKRNVRMAQP